MVGRGTEAILDQAPYHGIATDSARRRVWWQRPWGWRDDARPRGYRPGNDITFGVHTLHIGSVIPYLEHHGGGSRLWSRPELLLRVGPALALLRLEDLHGLADRRQHQHVWPSREDSTGIQDADSEEQYTPSRTHKVSSLVRFGQEHYGM